MLPEDLLVLYYIANGIVRANPKWRFVWIIV
jgi:hypothetical protein